MGNNIALFLIGRCLKKVAIVFDDQKMNLFLNRSLQDRYVRCSVCIVGLLGFTARFFFLIVCFVLPVVF